MSKPKRRLTFDIDFDDYGKMRDVLFESDCKSMAELFRKSVFQYAKSVSIEKENKMLHERIEKISKENKDLKEENKFLLKILNLDEAKMFTIEKILELKYDNKILLGLKKENKILRTRLMDIRRICNYITENKVRLSKQYLLDIKRLTLHLDKCYLEEAAYE